MADSDLDRVLIEIAEAIAGRSLTTAESDAIKKGFANKAGSPIQRAIRAIGDSLGITESTGQQKFAASDNPDRLMLDLLQAISPKKP